MREDPVNPLLALVHFPFSQRPIRNLLSTPEPTIPKHTAANVIAIGLYVPRAVSTPSKANPAIDAAESLTCPHHGHRLSR